MAWPSPVDFRDAVQTPQQCFETDFLAQGTTAVTSMGTPLVYSGNFACVFKVNIGGRDVAVRCFTREIKDQRERYGHLSDYLKGVKPEAFVGFEYMERGIRVKGDWYPTVMMDWAEGDRLDKFRCRPYRQAGRFPRLGRPMEGRQWHAAGPENRPQRPATRERDGTGAGSAALGRLRWHIPAPVQRATQPRDWAPALSTPGTVKPGLP